MESIDVAIIGAGIHGLVMLKTYRDVHPYAKIVLLEKANSIGGVWARDRLYPGLHTNNHFRTYEFSGFPMNTEGYNLADDHIPGEHVNEYLHQYAKAFDLEKYIRFECGVESALDLRDAGWILTVKNTKDSAYVYELKAKKLIIATGLTSEPFMPKIEGIGSFDAPIYHSSEFAKAENGLGAFKKVVILSGAKYSWDVAYAYAVAGVQVDWIIRKSGHGPCWMMPNRLTPFKIIPEFLLQTRLITWLSPCIWDDGFSWVRKFLHRSWLGRRIVDTFYAKMQHSAEKINGYDRHPETAKLKPWDDLFFVGTNRGLLNYNLDFFQFVRDGQIRVHIADIERLSRHEVHLTNAISINADVLICGTGWKDTPQLNFKSEKVIGLPGNRLPSMEQYVAEADLEILKSCPKLQNQPSTHHVELTADKDEAIAQPYRLYRFIVPPAFRESRTLAFAGAYRSPLSTLIAQTQALWITAFLDDNLHTLRDLTAKQVLYDTILHSQFCKLRYSRGFGARFPDFWFDSLPYIDLLLKDIGIQNERKKNWWAERFTPYMPGDYTGIVEEYKALNQQST